MEINGVSIVGKSLADLPAEVSKVTLKTGHKPAYVVVDEKQHEEIACAASIVDKKIKQGNLVKWKGMSVIVTPMQD